MRANARGRPVSDLQLAIIAPANWRWPYDSPPQKFLCADSQFCDGSGVPNSGNFLKFQAVVVRYFGVAGALTRIHSLR